MIDRKTFYDAARASLFGGELSAGQVQGTDAILDAWAESGRTDRRWLAYMLATAFHETGPLGAKGHMLPISERGDAAYFKRYDPGTKVGKVLGNTEPGDGFRYRGRGFVQLTGRANYERASHELGVALGADPDLALEMGIAAQVMIRGMTQGWFTGRALADYFPAGREADWKNARRIINGLDRAELVAGYGKRFHQALAAATAASAMS